MSISFEDYLAGGYVITHFVNANSLNQWMKTVFGIKENLLPGKILSVGFCGTYFAPLFDWDGIPDEAYIDFGIPDNLRHEVNTWANEGWQKKLGYPNIFFELSSAREYINRFIHEPQDIQLLGIGLHKADIGKLDEIEKLNPSRIGETGARIAGFAGDGFDQAVRMGKFLTEGEILGFDVIACMHQIDHSWHCNGLARDALEKFQFRPNQFGLIEDKSNADKLANYANERLIEDSIWLSVLVTRYAVAVG